MAQVPATTLAPPISALSRCATRPPPSRAATRPPRSRAATRPPLSTAATRRPTLNRAVISCREATRPPLSRASCRRAATYPLGIPTQRPLVGPAPTPLTCHRSPTVSHSISSSSSSSMEVVCIITRVRQALTRIQPDGRVRDGVGQALTNTTFMTHEKTGRRRIYNRGCYCRNTKISKLWMNSHMFFRLFHGSIKVLSVGRSILGQGVPCISPWGPVPFIAFITSKVKQRNFCICCFLCYTRTSYGQFPVNRKDKSNRHNNLE